ncbi:hypothetical protein OS493_000340 [Desmophyllum pertusum]|uniref:Uncharacterized protein n=1 Tax=Desmophyllum pertusum TaxID=174260 RepID=A0A9X0A772_9CNID|nr:hypothetical protein OS493_000340 [Desmophyllum pertusum]
MVDVCIVLGGSGPGDADEQDDDDNDVACCDDVASLDGEGLQSVMLENVDIVDEGEDEVEGLDTMVGDDVVVVVVVVDDDDDADDDDDDVDAAVTELAAKGLANS